MAATTIGLSGLSFGTTAEDGAVVRSYEETIKCDPVELLDGDGTFQAVAFSNPNSSANITIVSGSASAGIGSAFSQTGNTDLTGIDNPLYVDSCSRTLTNDGFAETQISASGWLNLGQGT
jgi:hypothetical protein